MFILGIETSCDETAASLVEAGNGKIKVLSNIVSSQVKLHAKYGGVVPSLAAREHVKNLRPVLELAVKGASLKKIDLISVTAGPGLISSLLVGTAFAKALAWKLKKPIVGVNHTEGHIASNFLPPIGSHYKLPTTNYKLFPALCLVVSGGHTQLILMRSAGWRIRKYKTVGGTLDDAAGEAFDKIARILELGYPGGPAIAKAAKFPISNFQFPIKLPRPMISSKNLDFSFSGLKTAVLYLDRDLKKKLGKNKLPKEIVYQIATEAQQAIVDVLISKTVKAAQKYGAKSIMLSGGVSANKLLRSELQKNAEQRKIKYFQPLPEYTTDNAAMIALAGYFSAKGGSASGGNRNFRHGNWKKVKTDANWELI